MKKVAFLTALALMLAIVGTALAQEPAPVVLGEVTQRILDRGEVICGVNDRLPGFGFPDDSGVIQGFDADFCRAVAAAILGDASAVNFRPVVAADRQTVLQSGEVDLISRNTTFTLTRDTVWGATFGPTTFYDGQGVMVFAESGLTDLASLEGGTICVNAGTTTELNITDAMESIGAEFELSTYQDFDAVMAAFNEGGCDAVTTDISGLVSQQASSADPGAYLILDVVLSKEPLGPLSPQGDAQFADIVRWVAYGLIQAEEFGISSDNVDDFLTSEDPNIQRFLGIGENASGSLLGIPNDFMASVVRQVGNYGEIFDRHLGPDTIFGLERGLNALYTDGGLLYSPPFR